MPARSRTARRPDSTVPDAIRRALLDGNFGSDDDHDFDFDAFLLHGDEARQRTIWTSLRDRELALWIKT